MFPALKLLPIIPARNLFILLPPMRKQPKAKLQGSKAWSIHVSMVIQRDSKAMLLLEEEAAPRDFTSVSATGWEFLPGSQMLMGKCIQYSSTSGTLGCHWNVGKHCDMMNKRLLGLYVPHPSFQLIGKNYWKVARKDKSCNTTKE